MPFQLYFPHNGEWNRLTKVDCVNRVFLNATVKMSIFGTRSARETHREDSGEKVWKPLCLQVQRFQYTIIPSVNV